MRGDGIPSVRTSVKKELGDMGRTEKGRVRRGLLDIVGRE